MQLKFLGSFMFVDCGLHYVMLAAAELQSASQERDPYRPIRNFWG
jgi:hypothetical protein